MKRVVSLVVLGLVVSACSPTTPESPTVGRVGVRTRGRSIAVHGAIGPRRDTWSLRLRALDGIAVPDPGPERDAGSGRPDGLNRGGRPDGARRRPADRGHRLLGGLLAFGQGEGHVPLWLSKDGRTWIGCPPSRP